jgi:hypothetical protein
MSKIEPTQGNGVKNKIEAALTYASWGWRVLPVVPNGKVPATAHGVNDATTDPEQIKRWWGQNPNLNIGIACGSTSGIVVFDIDPRNGGDASWQQWLSDHGPIYDGVMAMTAGGGQHYVAKHVDGIRSCKLADGIDLLADGRYFIVYPSTIENRAYEWEASSDPFDGVAPSVIPNHWLPLLGQRKVVPTTNGDLIQGNRNDGLTSLAGAMRSFGMTEAEILAAISVANETRCEIPLPSSEIKQIARSVSRYEPDADVAASSAIGSEAADALLSESPTRDYFLTRATSFLGQPSPVPWIVKGWLPAYATTMMYGESGVGKTFVALDMACCIASGIDWHGIRTKPGIVVYLAGEGNYGMRQRIASWCKRNNVNSLDNLLISNKAIDMDGPGAATQVIAAVRALTSEPVALVNIDTLNNHMSGDENSAKDSRAMINACNVVSMALSATTMLIHHLGHSNEAKQRARGSSAWRGALDASILVHGKSHEIIVSCTKQKDAPEPSDLFGCLSPVDLGWQDEDGMPLPGAVFEMFAEGDLRIPQPKEDKLADHKANLERAWFVGGAEIMDQMPYVSREAFKTFLLEQGIKTNSVDQHLKSSARPGMIIRDLTDAEIIGKHDKGWLVKDTVFASKLIIKVSP